MSEFTAHISLQSALLVTKEVTIHQSSTMVGRLRGKC